MVEKELIEDISKLVECSKHINDTNFKTYEEIYHKMQNTIINKKLNRSDFENLMKVSDEDEFILKELLNSLFRFNDSMDYLLFFEEKLDRIKEDIEYILLEQVELNNCSLNLCNTLDKCKNCIIKDIKNDIESYVNKTNSIINQND